MTDVTKSVSVAVGIVAAPAIVASRLVVKALQGPDHFDPAMPPPCWVPVLLPDRRAIVKSGSTATLEIAVTNLGAEAETYDVATNSPAVVVDSPLLVLGPLERATVVLELAIPSGTAHGPLPPVVVTVGGCKTYRFRWLLTAKRWHPHQLHPHHHHHGHLVHGHHGHAHLVHGHRAHGHWHRVEIVDQPDFQHHWYDHFSSECGCDHA